MKKTISIVLVISILFMFGACSKKEEYAKYRYSFFGTFDTMIEMMAYCKTDKEFDEISDSAEEMFIELNALFDKYNDYDVANIKTINDNAGIKPVAVDERIIQLILLSKQWYEKTDGIVNIAYGPVLNIWHDYRELYKGDEENAKLPELSELEEAEKLTDINKVIIDEAAGTVFLEEKGMSLDVGAVAKGYATELVAQELIKSGTTSFIISSGGNVRVGSEPLDGVRSTWGIGIHDPQVDIMDKDKEYLDTIFINDSSVVSSGDYQRYYMVDGKKIHHVIDPKTMHPANNYSAVTVITPTSGEADIMSTAIYIMDYERGKAFAQENNFDVVWVFENGEIKTTDGIIPKLKNLGGATSQLQK